MGKIKIALLHLLPIAGDVEYNQKLIEQAIHIASNNNAEWIITPELCVSGLQFNHKIGTGWINRQPDAWMSNLSRKLKNLKTTVFLGCPEKGSNGELYNSVFVIDKKGHLLGKQRKISVIDDWSASGDVIEPIKTDNVEVGIMICADAYTNDIANNLFEKGAEILIAPSSWGPGLHGPEGEWEQRSLETGLPVIVCNRTGEDETVRFWDAESMIIKNGVSLLTHKSKQSAILTFEWDLQSMELISSHFEVDYI
ncbi:carbon-nitrogen hydrolase family protein [Peribacillus simplex]|uniref:Formamidase n=1 Tax=Peribacillus simplex TaxID=1478 RepID=A0A9W4L302_9BACI|nr:carbon-nitrogen hydrolase family protein [Peribacillus simplex]WHX93002.1 carbon-nitrogen hydrolase family protein [Peribacillus simplex]CAH0298251.1 Formamidase [Peribacillus simplex]